MSVRLGTRGSTPLRGCGDLSIGGLLCVLVLCLAGFAGVGALAGADPMLALDRIDRAFPTRAKVEVRRTFVAAPNKSLGIDRMVERSRRAWKRSDPGNPGLGKSLEAERRIYERMQKGYREERIRTCYWAPNRVRIEQVSPDIMGGPPHRRGMYYLDNTSYLISRSIGSANVVAGNQVFDGSFAEGLYFTGVRLGAVLDRATLKESTERGAVRLDGRLRFPPGQGAFFPEGATIRVWSSPTDGYLPKRLEVRHRGELREIAEVLALEQFPGLAYPSRLKVTRYANGRVQYTWEIDCQSAQVLPEAELRALEPAVDAKTYVFDARMGAMKTYELTAGEAFPSLQELARRNSTR